jgi:glycosyl hydrolase family 44
MSDRVNARPPPRSCTAAKLRVSGWIILLVAALCMACPASSSRPPDEPPQGRAAEPLRDTDPIYDHGPKPGWVEAGSALRTASAEGPVRLHFGSSGDWILSRSELVPSYSALLFWVKEPPGEGEFLQVGLGSNSGETFRPVKLKPDYCTAQSYGWTQVVIPMTELNPKQTRFDRLVFSSFRPVGETWLLLDQISLAKTATASTEPLIASRVPPASTPSSAPSAPRIARVPIDCKAQATKISPLIYGIGGADDARPVGATIRRWGGNPTSRYNWETHFWNSAQDWFFENHVATQYTAFLADATAHEATTAVTLPMIGWAAKDGTSYAFPVSSFGPQAKTDPWRPDVGNGVNAAGVPIAPGPPSITSTAAPPEWVARWVSAIASQDGKTGLHSVSEYILDNEPMLWSTTHRDLHPEPLGYDELLERTIQYASAVRAAQRDAVIAGPAEWGWSGYFYSAKDLDSRFGRYSDRHAHGDLALAEWYLSKLREYEARTGTRLIDLFDLHYYPQEDNVYGGGSGGTDGNTQRLRLRSTRSLWDPSYVDESWIKDKVRLLPRMREWVDKNYPGLGISVGEWNFGGEKDITGALATAETLGRFAQFGVTSAFYWTVPPPGSSSSFGFLAYRNFDGKGGHFLEWYVPTTPQEGISIFVSRDAEGKHLVITAINLSPDTPLDAELDVGSCGEIASRRAYAYPGTSGFAPIASTPDAPSAVRGLLAAWSITVFDVRLRDSSGAK